MRILHIFDVSNYIYIGNARKVNAIRGIHEYEGAYTVNRAPVGGITFLADKVLDVINQGEDILLAFDKTPTVKRQMYKDILGIEKKYKGNRTPNPGIFVQKDYAERFMSEAEVPVGYIEGHEADDVIYTVWKYYHDDYDYIRIHTEDSDLAFMIDEKTDILSSKRDGKHITMDNYLYTVHKDKVTPYNMASLLKMICGDPSDNIPGAAHGQAEAVAWLNAYHETCEQFDFSVERLGDLDYARDTIIKTVATHPELPGADKALSLFDLVTPMLVPIENIDPPGNQCRVDKLEKISSIQMESGYTSIESILSEYIDEYNKNK